MSIILPTIKDRVLYLADYKEDSKQKFFKKTGLKYSNFTGKSKESDLGSKYLTEILLNYPDVNLEWLLTGDGSIVKEEKFTALISAPIGKGIPLIPVEAFAGAALNNGYSLDFDTIEERYSVPLFDDKGVDFLMYVRGSSMYPRYNSGDVVACRFVRERLFIQWNKVYIIDSRSQGAMIKRLLPSNNPDQVICRSDNKDYIDFEVPLSDIQNIALVVGSISLD
jgi:repressor LexA